MSKTLGLTGTTGEYFDIEGPSGVGTSDWHLWMIQAMADAIAFDLESCYEGSIQLWLSDRWCGDMPWTEREYRVVAENIRTHPEFRKLEAQFKEKWGVGFFEAQFKEKWGVGFYEEGDES
jgi:hypothetical protein